MSDASGLVVATCPQLDIKSQGRDETEARAALVESVTLFLVHCWKRGIFEQTLAKRGFEAFDGEDDGRGEMVSVEDLESAPAIDSKAPHEWEAEFQIPFHVIAEHNRRTGAGACLKQ